MKKLVIGIVAVLLAAGLVAGGFFGGMAYQKNQAEQIQANFFNQRGGNPNGAMPSFEGGVPLIGDRQSGQFPTDSTLQGRGAPGDMFSGVDGQIKEIDLENNTLTLSTAEDVTTVTLSAETVIQKMADLTPPDLEPGQRVMVAGDRDEDGNLKAIQITIIPDRVTPTRTETAP